MYLTTGEAGGPHDSSACTASQTHSRPSDVLLVQQLGGVLDRGCDVEIHLLFLFIVAYIIHAHDIPVHCVALPAGLPGCLVKRLLSFELVCVLHAQREMNERATQQHKWTQRELVHTLNAS